MAVSIDYSQTRSIVSGKYRQVWTITASTDIPQELIVRNATTGAFYRVAQYPDDFDFPTAPEPLTYTHYRSTTATIDSDTPTAAEAAEAAILAALGVLAAAYQAGADTWTGSDTGTIP